MGARLQKINAILGQLELPLRDGIGALGILIAFRLAGELALSSTTLVHLSFLVFIAPAFLFSATAGQIADRVEKSGLIRRIKIAEVLVMLLRH